MSGEGCTAISLRAVLARLDRLEDGSRIVLLRGPPDSGKTPVAKSVARSLDSEQRLAASFFVDNMAISFPLFVSTLAAQIAERHPWYGSAVQKIIFNAPSILRESPTDQLHRLIVEPICAIYAHEPELIQESFIVVDDSDEGGTPEDLDQLKRLVTGLESLPKPFRVFFSHRRTFPKSETPSPSFAPIVAENRFLDIFSSLQEYHSRSPSPNNLGTTSKTHSQARQRWDAEPGEAVVELLLGHTGAVSSVSFSPDGRRIASGSADHTIIIWDAESGEAVGEPLRGHDGLVLCVSFSPDGKRIVSGSYDYTVRIWDAETGKAVGGPLIGHTEWVRGVSFSPDGRCIVSGSHDCTLRIWDAESGEAKGTFRGHSSVWSISLSPNGKRIASGATDNHSDYGMRNQERRSGSLSSATPDTFCLSRFRQMGTASPRAQGMALFESGMQSRTDPSATLSRGTPMMSLLCRFLRMESGLPRAPTTGPSGYGMRNRARRLESVSVVIPATSTLLPSLQMECTLSRDLMTKQFAFGTPS